jgi:serine/threonine protein kinase
MYPSASTIGYNLPKKGNVLIDDDGVARLCDFGLAHLVVTGSENSTTATCNVGTIRYAAPELRSPANDDDVVRATTSTDIYSLACMGYEVKLLIIDPRAQLNLLIVPLQEATIRRKIVHPIDYCRRLQSHTTGSTRDGRRIPSWPNYSSLLESIQSLLG